MRPRALDPRLGPAFSARSALDIGETPGRLRSGDLEMPYRRARTSGEVEAWVAYAPLLRPGERFSHITAARIWGAPVPRERSRDVHTSVPLSMSRAKSHGVVGHQTNRTRFVIRNGVPVSAPEDLLLELAGELAIEDVVAVADYLVLDPRRLDPRDLRPYSSTERLRDAARRYRGRGAKTARRAADLARQGSESPMETRLRLLLCATGVPEPVCGYEVCLPSGRTLGFFDLAWPDFRVIAEYDGDQHRVSTYQYEKDIRRFDAAEAAGWRVIRVRAAGVFKTPGATATRVLDALRARGWHAPRHPVAP